MSVDREKLLGHADPIVNVISRILAWESKINAVGFRELDEERLFDLIDDEIGTKISATQFNQRKDEIEKEREKKLNDWRYLYLPSHKTIRTQAYTAAELDFKSVSDYALRLELAFRDPALPWLHVFIGEGNPPIGNIEFINRRAIYILRHAQEQNAGQENATSIPESMYIGKADDSAQRMRQHQKPKKPHLWFIAVPANSSQQFNGDVRDATEALMISLWSEVACVSNDNLGTTVLPAANADLLYAISLTTAISAAYLYMILYKREEVCDHLGIKENSVTIPLLSVYGNENYTKRPDGIKSIRK